MNKIIITLLTLSIPLTVFANELDKKTEDKYLKISRQSSKELLTNLKSQLKSALSNKDIVNAINVCSNIAPEIAKNISNKNNIQIKRVSLKNRNPNGKPDKYEEEKLNLFDSMNKNNSIKENTDLFDVVKEDKSTFFRYMKPIKTSNTCLQCHGSSEQIKKDVKTNLLKIYPKDLAFGYKEGDIRGAVSIKIKI